MKHSKNERTHASALSCYFNEVSHYPPLSVEDEQALCQKIIRGDEAARHTLIRGNLRLVISTARQYSHPDLPLEDLIEEGNFGLMHATHKFKPELGFRFSTYAIWWIRQYIERGIMNCARTVRLPVHVAKRLNRYVRASRKLSQNMCREINAQDIAKHLDAPIDEVRELLPWLERPTSLDSGHSDTHWHEILPANNFCEPELQTSRDDLCRHIHQRLQQLTAREQRVLCLRHGLFGHPKITLEEVAKDIGYTRERARQIQLEAQRKMREWMIKDGIESNFLEEE